MTEHHGKNSSESPPEAAAGGHADRPAGEPRGATGGGGASRGPDYAKLIFRVHKEMHARVAEPITAPCRVRHSAYLMPGDSRRAEAEMRSHFEEVVRNLDLPPGAIRWGERSGRVIKTLSGGNSLIIVWEQHTEFYSYTTYHMAGGDAERKSGRKGDGSGDEPVEPFTFPILSGPGDKMVDLDIMVMRGLKMEGSLPAFLHPGPIFGGVVLDGAARVWTSFQVDENGQGRYVAGAGKLPPGRLGRLIRRLVEIENYYHLILLPLDDYREQVLTVREIEQRLTVQSEDIAAGLADRVPDPAREHRWLGHLTRDLSELTRVTERMRYSLSAANSYYAIFNERLKWLREETGEGFQSMEEFLTARVSPAVRNYRNFIERAGELAGQLTSLGNMMRTRINLNMEQQSLETMRAMDRRAELQMILQRTVEGLSLIVLSYYMTGLAGYVLKAVDKFQALPGGVTLWTAATIPFWVAMAWAFTRRIKRMVKNLKKTKGE